jgi:DNA adenine methylase
MPPPPTLLLPTPSSDPQVSGQQVSEPAVQYSLFDGSHQEAIVNVASVPQRSPFRYPGGKTWLIPRIREWLRSRPERPVELIEPFAGGGIVSLTAAFECLTQRVRMVELDPQVAAVWETIVSGQAAWLAEAIADFSLTPETVAAALADTCPEARCVAFRTILKNRINRGGILAPGAGVIKYGENGKGLLSRWYPETLRRRILEIAAIRDRITFEEGDGISVMCRSAECAGVVYFIDPPYTASQTKSAGSRLYLHSVLDHERLFQVTATVRGDFLMTYDNAPGVHDLAKHHGFDALPIPMKNTHHAEMTELLIGRDLEWARG